MGDAAKAVENPLIYIYFFDNSPCLKLLLNVKKNSSRFCVSNW